MKKGRACVFVFHVGCGKGFWFHISWVWVGDSLYPAQLRKKHLSIQILKKIQ